MMNIGGVEGFNPSYLLFDSLAPFARYIGSESNISGKVFIIPRVKLMATIKRSEMARTITA
jgi:hypothetical protein